MFCSSLTTENLLLNRETEKEEALARDTKDRDESRIANVELAQDYQDYRASKQQELAHDISNLREAETQIRELQNSRTLNPALGNILTTVTGNFF